MASLRHGSPTRRRAAGSRRWRRVPTGRTVTARTAELALQCIPAPSRVLHVGCGTGELLRHLASSAPTAVVLVGVDPSSSAVARARRISGDDRLRFDVGAADGLPYPDGTFDLVVVQGSPSRWSDAASGLAQCARVLASGGRLVVAGRGSVADAIGSVIGRGIGPRSRRRTERLLVANGFESVQWHPLVGAAVRALSASPAGAPCPAVG